MGAPVPKSKPQGNEAVPTLGFTRGVQAEASQGASMAGENTSWGAKALSPKLSKPETVSPQIPRPETQNKLKPKT